MAHFLVTLTDQTTERVDQADAYQQEGPLTTFFALADGREVIDSWSRRQASFRTVDLVAVRRIDDDIEAVARGVHTNDEGSESGRGVDDNEPAPLLRSA